MVNHLFILSILLCTALAADELSFDGSSGQYLVLNDPPSFVKEGFTVATWARFDSDPDTGNNRCLFSLFEPIESFQVSLTDLRRIQVIVVTDSGIRHEYESHNPTLEMHVWHQIAVGYHPIGGVRITIDGRGNVTPLVRQLNLFKGNLKQVDQPIYYGACNDGKEGVWKGELAYPRLWSTRVSVSNIRNEMFNTKDGLEGSFHLPGGLFGKGVQTKENSWDIQASKDRLADIHADLNEHTSFAPLQLRTAPENTDRDPLVIVRPFIKKQVPLLVWNMKKWATSRFFPCSSTSTVDLMFYYHRDLDTEHEIKAELTKAIEANQHVRRCFRNILFKSARLKKVRDNHPDGPCWQFYDLFSSTELVNNYRFLFLMEPDVQVIRPFWLDRLIKEVKFADFQDFWIKGSLSHCEGNYAFMDFHINGNALYKLGDGGFNRFIEDTWQYFLLSEQESRPGGCAGGMGGHDHAMFLYLTAPENYARVHKIFHKFSYTSFIINYCIFEYRPWTTIRHYPHAYFVHSSWANFRDTWDRYGHEYMVSTDVDDEWSQAGDAIARVEIDVRKAREILESVL